MAIYAHQSYTKPKSNFGSASRHTASRSKPKDKSPPPIERGKPSISRVAMIGLGHLDTLKFFTIVRKNKFIVIIDPRRILSILNKKQLKFQGHPKDPFYHFPISILNCTHII